MIPIPKKMRKEMEDDPYYKNCCLTGIPYTKEKICWHHHLIFAGKRVNEKFCILPVVNSIHNYHQGFTREIKEKLDLIMLNRATDEELKKYSKAVDLIAKRDRLNKKFKYDN